MDCKSQLWQKVNGQSQPSVKVNGQRQRWSTVKSTSWSTMTSASAWQMTSADAVVDDVSKWRGRWRHLGLTLAEEPWRVAEAGGAWRRVGYIGGAWRRVPVTPRLLVARGGVWEVWWRRNFTEREIGEISFRWCNLWSDRRSGSDGGGKAVVFDVLKSRWRQWCCSQQRLQMTPKKTRLLKSGTPMDQSSGSNTMLEILKELYCISSWKNIHQCLI